MARTRINKAVIFAALCFWLSSAAAYGQDASVPPSTPPSATNSQPVTDPKPAASSRVPAPVPQSAAQPGSGAAAFDQLVDRVIATENTLLALLHKVHPLAETYIQEMGKDPDFGYVPTTDHYFLGKVDLSKGISDDSFVPKSQSSLKGFAIFNELFSTRFLPRGFVQMMVIDGDAFDRGHYQFRYVHREFLGDLRTYVIEVSPASGAGGGRFNGRIWVEDRGSHIVRFSGTYGKGLSQHYLHFDSWRLNTGPDVWVPYEIYSEESAMPVDFNLRKVHYKALTQLWGYTRAEDRNKEEFTSITVDLPAVQDHSDQAADYSPVEGLRNWKRQSEDNILNRLERANLMGRAGPVEKILDTVVNNMVVTNNLVVSPEVRTRVLLTTPLETFTVGHTIVISRGLLDTLPDEASLAAMLTHELAHIVLGHDVDTKFAFGDLVNFNDEAILRKFRFARPNDQEEAANQKTIELLQKSPYADKLKQAGLFLKALVAESSRLPSLIKPLTGDRIVDNNRVLRLAALLEAAPELQRTRTDQIAALPLGSRTKLDPWSDGLRMSRTRVVPLLSAREKMPFEITPVYVHLTYEDQPESLAAAPDGTPAGDSPPVSAAPPAPAANPDR